MKSSIFSRRDVYTNRRIYNAASPMKRSKYVLKARKLENKSPLVKIELGLHALLYGTSNDLEAMPDPMAEGYVTQAERILMKFGGPARLHRLLAAIGIEMDRTTFYKWIERGGTVPSRSWPVIFEAAKADGVVILPEDLDPRAVYMERKHIPKRIRQNRKRPMVI